jgi:DNA-binding XRE family transcriptional regulator
MKLRRIEMGHTLETLGKSVGGEPTWKLSMVENGLDPGNELALKIAEVLECKIEDIFPVWPPDRFAEKYIRALIK